MQIRCYNCHRPFALSNEQVHAALDQVEAKDLHHYNARCPFCRKMNRISREELMHSAPDWKPASEKEESGDK